VALSKQEKLRRAAERQKVWRLKNPERSKEIAQKNYRKNGAHPNMVQARRRYHLQKTYGLTLEQYEQMLLAQNGVCAICKRPESVKVRGTLKSLHVDHNHETGQVRELLCGACNSAFGSLCEDSEIILAMFDYAVKHNGE
jgi:hypothetical protein